MRHEFSIDFKPVQSKPAAVPKPARVPFVRRSLVLAFQIADYMAENDLATLDEFCRWARITPTRTTQIMNLLLLSPVIQREILIEESFSILSLRERDLRPIAGVKSWKHQEHLWRMQMSAVTKAIDSSAVSDAVNR